MESLTIGVPYQLHQMVSLFADDESTMILQKEMSDGELVYISWPTCPFHPDEVSRINNVRCVVS